MSHSVASDVVVLAPVVCLANVHRPCIPIGGFVQVGRSEARCPQYAYVALPGQLVSSDEGLIQHKG